MIKKYTQKFTKHSFVVQVATLMSGTVVSQGILFAATPLLTRLYTPEEFGIFALYLAIIGPISVASSWKYDMAIMLPKENEDAKALLVLSMFITLLMSLLTLLFIVIFEEAIVLHLTEHIGLFLWLVPLGVFTSGFFQILSTWNTRNQLYNNIAQAKVLRSSTAVTIQIATKTVMPFSAGLVWGNMIASVVASAMLLYKAVKEDSLRLHRLTYDRIKKNAKEHDKFPKYQSFATFISALSQNMPVILLSFFYSPEIAGYYALTNRVLMAPVSLISGSVRNVYYQNASKKFSLNESIKELYLKTTLNMFKLGLIPFILIAIFAEPIFISLFGDRWLLSAEFTQIIFILLLMIFINPAATMTIYILGLQKFALKFTIVSASLRVAALYAGYLFFNSYYVSLALMSITGSLLALYLILFVYRQTDRVTHRTKGESQ